MSGVERESEEKATGACDLHLRGRFKPLGLGYATSARSFSLVLSIVMAQVICSYRERR
jgi:hypothetical protein